MSKKKSVVLGRELNSNTAVYVLITSVLVLLVGLYFYGESDRRPVVTPTPLVATFTPSPALPCTPTLNPLSFVYSTTTTSFRFKQIDTANYIQTTPGNLNQPGSSIELSRRIVTFTLTNQTASTISIDRDTSPAFRNPIFVADGIVWDELKRLSDSINGFQVDYSKPHSPVITRFNESDKSKEDIIILKPRGSIDFMYLVPPGEHVVMALGVKSFRAQCPSEAWSIY